MNFASLKSTLASLGLSLRSIAMNVASLNRVARFARNFASLNCYEYRFVQVDARFARKFTSLNSVARFARTFASLNCYQFSFAQVDARFARKFASLGISLRSLESLASLNSFAPLLWISLRSSRRSICSIARNFASLKSTLASHGISLRSIAMNFASLKSTLASLACRKESSRHHLRFTATSCSSYWDTNLFLLRASVFLYVERHLNNLHHPSSIIDANMEKRVQRHCRCVKNVVKRVCSISGQMQSRNLTCKHMCIQHACF